MSNDFVAWLTFLYKFCYDALYSVNVPGLNIPVLYVLIITSLIVILFTVVRRMLYQPSNTIKNASKVGKELTK